MLAKLKFKNKRPNSRGDTILSVMISVVIIGSVISTTYYAINSSLRLGRQSQERSRALDVAVNQVERIKALLDEYPDLIFEDTTGINSFNSNPSQVGFGHRFCLYVEPFYVEPFIVIKHDNAPDPLDYYNTFCRNPNEIGLPANAQPRIEVKYQKHKIHPDPSVVNCNSPPPSYPTPELCKRAKADNDRFEIAVYWTPLGGGPGAEEEIKVYYRSHPLIF